MKINQNSKNAKNEQKQIKPFGTLSKAELSQKKCSEELRSRSIDWRGQKDRGGQKNQNDKRVAMISAFPPSESVLTTSCCRQPYFRWFCFAEVSESSIYDLASVTKMLSTTMALMKLVDEGKIDVEKTIGDYIEFPAGHPHAKMQLKRMLSHTAGLPAWKDFTNLDVLAAFKLAMQKSYVCNLLL